MRAQVLDHEQRRSRVGLLRQRPLATPPGGQERGLRGIAGTPRRTCRRLGRQRRVGRDRGNTGLLHVLLGRPILVTGQLIGQAQLVAWVGHRRVLDFGLRMSSRAFPTSVKASTTSTTQTAGGAMYHQAPRPGAPAL